MDSYHENIAYQAFAPIDHESDYCSHSYSSKLEKACHQQSLLVVDVPLFRELADSLNTEEHRKICSLRIPERSPPSPSIHQEFKIPFLLVSRTLFGQKTSFLN